MSKTFWKITDWEGHRLRITPTAFTIAETRFGRTPVIYADVTVLLALDPPLDLGNIAIFQKMVISQIKQNWVGKPITGTLLKRESGKPGYPPLWILNDVEIG